MGPEGQYLGREVQPLVIDLLSILVPPVPVPDDGRVRTRHDVGGGQAVGVLGAFRILHAVLIGRPIRDVVRQIAVVLLVSHPLDELRRIAGVGSSLDDGQIVGEEDLLGP